MGLKAIIIKTQANFKELSMYLLYKNFLKSKNALIFIDCDGVLMTDKNGLTD